MTPLLSVTDAARLAGTTRRRLWRRLLVLHRIEPKLLVAIPGRKRAVGKWWVRTHIFRRLFGLGESRQLKKLEREVELLRKRDDHLEERIRRLEKTRPQVGPLLATRASE